MFNKSKKPMAIPREVVEGKRERRDKIVAWVMFITIFTLMVTSDPIRDHVWSAMEAQLVMNQGE